MNESNESETARASTSAELSRSDATEASAITDTSTSFEVSHSETTDASTSINLSDVTDTSATVNLSEGSANTAIGLDDANDIGFYINRKCTDEEKYRLIKNRWIPSENYKFKVNEYRNLRFQRKWLLDYHWLSYSVKDDGAYCHYCVFFCTQTVGRGGHTKPQKLVHAAHKDWKKAREKFNHHEELDYHKTAVVFGQNFIDLRDKNIPNISLQLDQKRKEEIEINRKIVASIIETIIFIGRQDIASRGHRDFGAVALDEPEVNEGNFRALLRFRIASGDDVLKNHFEKTKTQYSSPLIQNEIITICGNVITDKIISKVKAAKYFSILADETTDISGIEQFSFSVRYVDTVGDEKILREDFLKFVPVTDVTGEGLSNTIINICNDLRLDKKNMVGQGYDGASVMSGKFKGCAAHITALCPHAVYVHCMNHVLNLAVGDSCKVPMIRNALGTMNEIIGFFRSSAQRQNYFRENAERSENDAKKKRLLRYCETRWVDRLNAIIQFSDLFPVIFASLQEIEEKANDESSKKSFILQQSIKSGAFIVAMVVIREIFSMTQPLSIYLQAKHVDLASAMEMSQNLIELFKKMRLNSAQKFQSLFGEATKLSESIGEEIKMPRFTQRQQNRENFDCDSPEDYFRLSIFIPFIDHFIVQLEDRLLNHKKLLSKIQNFLPCKIASLEEKEIDDSVDVFLEQWGEYFSDILPIVIKKEALLWQQKWIGRKERPFTFIDSLNFCEESAFPNIHTILQICATLPVSVATAERSFSTLKRIKTYLRNSMGQIRLNGLALMSIHRDIKIEINEVLNIFKEKNRKMSL